MRLKLSILAAGFVGAILLVPAAVAAGPVDAISADAAKIQADVQAAHDAILADVHSALGEVAKGKDNKEAIKAALRELRSDLRSAHETLRADRHQLRTDLVAARDEHVAKDQIKPILQHLRDSVKPLTSEVRDALGDLRDALKGLRR